MLAADDRTALAVSLSPGQAHGEVEGRKLLTLRGLQEHPAYLLIDRAYDGNVTWQAAASGVNAIAVAIAPEIPPPQFQQAAAAQVTLIHDDGN